VHRKVSANPKPYFFDSEATVHLELVKTPVGVNDLEREIGQRRVRALAEDPAAIRFHAGLGCFIA
jgi:hypothetical protein